MECRHCYVSFHANDKTTYLGSDKDGHWFIIGFDCPKCEKYNLFLLNSKLIEHKKSGIVPKGDCPIISIRPLGYTKPCPPEVPNNIAENYNESCKVMTMSPKASAALSRRCLQTLIREKGNVKPGSLNDEIQQVIDSGSLPSYLAEEIDAVRTIGNFAAHPIKSKNTGEIIPVESGEAEWNLNILEGLFDFYYVQPVKAAKRREDLNAKLQEAGKQPLKTT